MYKSREESKRSLSGSCNCCGHGRILAPTTYIFFASALPVIAFGEQLERDTSECQFTLLLLQLSATI